MRWWENRHRDKRRHRAAAAVDTTIGAAVIAAAAAVASAHAAIASDSAHAVLNDVQSGIQCFLGDDKRRFTSPPLPWVDLANTPPSLSTSSFHESCQLQGRWRGGMISGRVSFGQAVYLNAARADHQMAQKNIYKRHLVSITVRSSNTHTTHTPTVTLDR